MATEWYQQGNWPLIGAVAGILIAHGVATWNIYAGVMRKHRSDLKVKEIEFLTARLTGFYNPVCTLLRINSEAFYQAGPKTFSKDVHEREAAALIWDDIKTDVVLPNNERLLEIIREKSHLISPKDDITKYLALANHVSMYKIFAERPSELYAKFQFPTGILEHADKQRSYVLSTLNAFKSEALK